MNKNRGMYLEDLINRSCNYIWNKKIGFVSKRFTKVHISKIIGNKVIGFLSSKNYVDYYGLINGIHIEFEAKTTKRNKFYFKNIKKAQIEFLTNIKNMGSISFFIIYFYWENIIIKIDVSTINDLINLNKKYLTIDQGIKKGKVLKVLYPGIINFWD